MTKRTKESWPLITRQDALSLLEKLHSERAKIMLSERLCGCSLFLRGRIASAPRATVVVESTDQLSSAEIPLDQEGTEFTYVEPKDVFQSEYEFLDSVAKDATCLAVILPGRGARREVVMFIELLE